MRVPADVSTTTAFGRPVFKLKPLCLRVLCVKVLRSSLLSAGDGALQRLVECGFGLFVLLGRNAALLPVPFQLEELFFQRFEEQTRSPIGRGTRCAARRYAGRRGPLDRTA